MKTTLDIADGLFERAKAHAKATRQPLRAIVEEGLRLVLDKPAPAKPYRLRDDLAVGPPWKPGDPNPYESMAPDDWHELMYGSPAEEIERIMGRAFVEQHLPELAKAPQKRKRS